MRGSEVENAINLDISNWVSRLKPWGYRRSQPLTWTLSDSGDHCKILRLNLTQMQRGLGDCRSLTVNHIHTIPIYTNHLSALHILLGTIKIYYELKYSNDRELPR